MIRPSATAGLQYELTPGAKTRAWDVDVEINAQGLRGTTVEPGDHRGVRILILGDAIAFGNYLRQEDTFAARLAELLRPEGDYQVLNFGVPGYDIVQELAQLQAKGLDYGPDHVVVAFCLNDAGHVSPNLELANVLRARAGNPLYHLRVANFVSDRMELSRQGRWLAQRNDPVAFAEANAGLIDPIGEDEIELRQWMAEVPPRHPARWYSWPDRVGRLRYAFRRFAELGEQHGFEVTVLVFPWLVEDEGQYPFEVAHRIVMHEIERAGLTGIDLTRELQMIGLTHLRVSAGDSVHPDRRGHALAARRLALRFWPEKKDDLLPRPR